ncbi:hypothetical protein F0562_034836 [Nyssa sinensis]|uniref:Uncharacterized protein n=1 Tax=Nyssa sinensis TaxID=561372 RepID=A0A5J5AAW1_9ASTE|nr:hypothetical protein F0562_034836 [Nyssa sinensis]
MRERILTRTANSLTQEVFVAAGGSTIVGPSHVHPLNGNHLHQHNWVPQAPFPSMDNTVNAANPALNSPAILRIAGTFSYRGAGQEPSARPIRHDRRSSAGIRVSAHASSSSSYQRSDVPPLSRFRIPREQPSNNLPSPVVRASMLANMRGSRNLPVWHRAEPSLSSTTQQAGYETNQVLQPRVSSGAGYDMQQGLTSDDRPPEDEADDSGVTMFQFL